MYKALHQKILAMRLDIETLRSEIRLADALEDSRFAERLDDYLMGFVSDLREKGFILTGAFVLVDNPTDRDFEYYTLVRAESDANVLDRMWQHMRARADEEYRGAPPPPDPEDAG